MNDVCKKHSIALVIPCFQSESLIGETLVYWKEYFESEGQECVFYLVDDHSSIESWGELIRNIKLVEGIKAELFRLRKNYGQPFATAFGVSVTNADVIYTSDDDLTIMADVFKRLVSSARQANKPYGFVSVRRNHKGLCSSFGSWFFNQTVRLMLGYSQFGSNHKVILNNSIVPFLTNKLHPNVFLDLILVELHGRGQYVQLSQDPSSFSNRRTRFSIWKKLQMTQRVILSLFAPTYRTNSRQEDFLEQHISIYP